MTPRTKSYLMLLVVAVIWGVATPVIKYTLQGFNPFVFLTYRFGISTIIAIIAIIIFKLHLPKNPVNLKNLFLYAFLTSTISLGFLFLGLNNTTVLDVSLITLAVPLLTTMAGAYFLKEHITKKERVGIGIAFLGTILTIIEPLIQNHNGATRLSGNLLIFGYLIATVWGAVIGKNLLKNKVSPILISNITFLVGFVSLLPFALLDKGFVSSISQVPFPYHLGVLYMAIISGSTAYYLSNKAQKTIEISEASVFSYLYPIFSAPIAVIWLGEKITPIFIIGAVIIAIGVGIAEVKKKRYNINYES